MLTFVSSIDFWLANECGRINLVASQENVSRVCNTATHIASNIVVATTIMTILTISVTTTEKIAELLAEIKDGNFVKNLTIL